MGQGVAQLPALIDGAGGLGSGVAGNAAGEGELPEELFHALGVLADVRVDLAVGAVQIVLGHHGVAPVTGAGDVDHIQVIFHNGPVKVGVDKVLAGTGAPVAHDGALEVFGAQGLPQQGVVQQVELAGGQIVGSAPPGVDGQQLIPGEGAFFGHTGRGLHSGLLRGVSGFRHGLISFA